MPQPGNCSNPLWKTNGKHGSQRSIFEEWTNYFKRLIYIIHILSVHVLDQLVVFVWELKQLFVLTGCSLRFGARNWQDWSLHFDREMA